MTNEKETLSDKIDTYFPIIIFMAGPILLSLLILYIYISIKFGKPNIDQPSNQIHHEDTMTGDRNND